MKPVRFHVATPTAESLFVAILRWYLVTSLGILIVLTLIELLFE